MSHDAKPGEGPAHDRALRALAAAQRREAEASDRLAALLDEAAHAAKQRSRALRDAARATELFAVTIADRFEAARTQRQSVLLGQQATQAESEAKTGRTRARASRAEAERARAQASTNENLAATRPKSRGARRGG